MEYQEFSAKNVDDTILGDLQKLADEAGALFRILPAAAARGLKITRHGRRSSAKSRTRAHCSGFTMASMRVPSSA